MGKGLGIGIEDKHFFEKTYFFYKQKAVSYKKILAVSYKKILTAFLHNLVANKNNFFTLFYLS